MPEGVRPESRYAAALVVIALFPACANFSLATLLFIPGIAAVIYLWFLKSHLLLMAALAISLAATFLVFGFGGGLFLMIGFAAPALLSATMQQRGHGLVRSGFVAMLPPLMALAASYRLLFEATDLVSAELKRMVASPEFAGLNTAADHHLLIEYVNWMTNTIVTLLPSILVATVSFVILAGGALGILLVRRQGIFAFGIKSFTMWKLPEWTLIPLAVAVLFILVEVNTLVIIGWNVLFLLFLLYSLCGLSLVEFLMRRHKLPRAIKVLIYVVLFFTQVIAGVLLPLAALFDSHFDFRRARAKQIG